MWDDVNLVLADPVVQLLMVRNGVTREDVEELLTTLQLARNNDDTRLVLRLSANTLHIPILGPDRFIGQLSPDSRKI